MLNSKHSKSNINEMGSNRDNNKSQSSITVRDPDNAMGMKKGLTKMVLSEDEKTKYLQY